MTLQTERLRTVEQIRGFLDGNGEVGFTPLAEIGHALSGRLRSTGQAMLDIAAGTPLHPGCAYARHRLKDARTDH